MIRTPAFLPIRARLTSLQAVGFAIHVLLPPGEAFSMPAGPPGPGEDDYGPQGHKGPSPSAFLQRTLTPLQVPQGPCWAPWKGTVTSTLE